MAHALLRSTDQFVPWPADPRVRYEPGAEVMAEEVAAALPHAIETVEERQYRSFASEPTVYVCASLKTFGSYGGAITSGGYVINHRLFLSPKPENTAERVPRVLTHELTHLHMEQQRGAITHGRLPFWFSEGLAAFDSGGGGAEGITAEETRRAILDGRVFAPETEQTWSQKTPSTYGLAPHLYYSEGAMFLGFLAHHDPARWRRFILGLEDGKSLETAFGDAYDEPLSRGWDRFVDSLKTDAIDQDP